MHQLERGRGVQVAEDGQRGAVRRQDKEEIGRRQAAADASLLSQHPHLLQRPAEDGLLQHAR